jgi:hypothetical protein
MEETTIAVTDSSGFKVDDGIGITYSDTRWWERLWYFMTFRRPPTIIEHYKITQITDSNTITIINP